MNSHIPENSDDVRLPVVILIGADMSTLDRVLSLGLNVFLMQPPDRMLPVQHPGVVGMLVADDRFLNKGDLIEMARTLARLYRVQCALSLNEYGCLPAAWINEDLGTPGVSVRAVELTRNKLAMRAATAAIDAQTWAEVSCDEDVIAFGRKAGWPVIVKPYDGVGSMRVHRVDSETQMPSIDWSKGGYISEKYLVGRLISVDSYSHDGGHTVYALNEEFPIGVQGPIGCNPYVETRHELPAQLSDLEARHISELVVDVLNALEIREGASHTEILLAASGPRLLECHTRPGGDHITDMYQQCTGIDLVELAIGGPLGLRTPPPAPLHFERGAALRYFTPPPGRLKAVSGLESSANLPGVVLLSLGVRPGAEIVELKSSGDRIGYVMAIGADAQEATATCHNVAQRVKLEVELRPVA